MDVNIYIATTIRAPHRGYGTGMYLIECPAKPDNIVKGFVHFPDTTEDAVTLTAMIEALGRFTKETNITIYTKCNGVYNGLNTGRIQSARLNGWINAKGFPNKNAELWDIFISMISKHHYTITQEDHSFMELMKTELKRHNSVIKKAV